jgi:protoporphyrinogen oxidase
MQSPKSVVVIGGGISGLACSLMLRKASANGQLVNVTLLEKSDRLGGQIRTERISLTGHNGHVIVEAGAEGFVARSTVFPKLAELAGLGTSAIIGQQRIADCELTMNHLRKHWDIVELEPGLAAQKLGFQVPKEHQGKGIRTFETGMGQLVDKISSEIPHRLNTQVRSIGRANDRFFVSTSSDYSLEADAVVLATSAENIKSLLTNVAPNSHFEIPSHHSHVSVHLLLKNGATRRAPSSFTVPADLQARFGGLRACSFVNEKFKGRCDDEHILFRFYFRPENVESLSNKETWLKRAHDALDEIFGILHPVVFSHFASWPLTLPSFTPGYLDRCGLLKDGLGRNYGGLLQVVGSEVTGAGLEAAAASGYDAAVRLVELL